jgi:dipeptidyl aminopeptidase/acylaminoacyl peptidase
MTTRSTGTGVSEIGLGEGLPRGVVRLHHWGVSVGGRRVKCFGAFGAVGAALLIAGSAEAAPPPLADYGKLPAVEVVELSPDGSKLAYVGAIKGERSIVVLQVGGEVLAATPLKDQMPQSLQWAGDEILLLSTARPYKPSGEMWAFQAQPVTELTAIDLKHRTSQSLIQTKTMRFYPGAGPLTVRQVGGRLYAFMLGSPQAPGADPIAVSANLYRVDLETAEATKVADAPARINSWALAPDGSVSAWGAFEPSSSMWAVRTEAGGKPLFRSDDGIFSQRIYGFGRSADTFIVGPDRRDTVPFTLVRADGSEPLQDQPHVQRLWFDPRTSQLIGYTAGADRMQVTLFDPRLQAKVQAAYKAFPGYVALLVSASADFSRMVVQTTGKDDPGTYWLVDLTTGKAKSLGMSASIQGKDLAPVSLFDYVAADGLAMHGVLTLPAGATPKNLPVVVMPTGTGAQRAYPAFDWWAQAFASRGYAVFQPNPRGVMGYGKAFYDAGRGELMRKTLSDVSDGVAALAAAGVIDKNRLCVVGADMSGFSALGVLGKERLNARCGVAFGAASNLKGALVDGAWQEIVFKNGMVQMVRSTSMPDFPDVSPSTFRANIKAPLLLIHPKDDANVPFKQSQTLADLMKRAGKSVELIELDGADHWMLDAATRTAVLESSVAFVERHNPPN